MADFRSPSPAQRPQLAQRNSSTQSLSRGSPSGLTSTSHKGSTHKLQKAHGVGHGRHPHTRLPSYGKNLNRLSKNTAAHVEEGESKTKHHARTKSQTPSTSPTTQNLKRNSSNVNLPRTGSKVNAKRNSSGLNLQQRNGSEAKLGKPGRAEKSYQGVSKTPAKFSVGSEEQDDEWTEESRSQSPEVVRQEAITQKPSKPTGLPSPDDPPARSPSKLPQSPPPSPPPIGVSTPIQHPPPQPGRRPTRPPDAEAVTSRLLSRNNAAPQLTSFSAAVTPTGSNSSPAFQHTISDATTLVNTDPSLGADGISRFLNQSGSSGSPTPASVSQLQSTLAALHREQRNRHPQSSNSPSSGSPPSLDLHATQRARSAANLTHPQLGTSSSRSPSPSQPVKDGESRPSPFESSRPSTGRKVQEASKSLTQLKLDLQRIASEHGTEKKKAVPSSLLQTSNSTLGAGSGLGASADGENERREKQYEQAGRELTNAARFEDIFGKALVRLQRRGLMRKAKPAEEGRRDGVKSVTGSLGKSPEDKASRPPSRGRVRFEIGQMDGEDDDDGQGDEEQRSRGLLRRMWKGDGMAVGGREE